MAARVHTARAFAQATLTHRHAAPQPRLRLALTVQAQALAHHATAGPCRRCAEVHSLPRDARAEHHAQCVPPSRGAANPLAFALPGACWERGVLREAREAG
jgi:hypothetical protein